MKANSSSRTAPLSFTDPSGNYGFDVVVDATGNSTPDQMRHFVIATRAYDSAEQIEAVRSTDFVLAKEINRAAQTSLVDAQTGDQLKSPGVEIAVVFQDDKTNHYTPTNVFVENTPIEQFTSTAGFWEINDQLKHLIETQSRGLITSQVGYVGKKQNHNQLYQW